MEEREYKNFGNDCIINIKKILTKFNSKYIIIKIKFYSNWKGNNNFYEKTEFDDENKAKKYFYENE